MSELSPDMAGLLRQAKIDNWDKVDADLQDGVITSVDLKWALTKGYESPDGRERDFGATLLAVSSLSLNESDLEILQRWFMAEFDPDTQCWLAVALAKRGVSSGDIQKLLKEAVEHENAKLAALAKPLTP